MGIYEFHDLRLIKANPSKVLFDLDVEYNFIYNEDELNKIIEYELESKLNKKYVLIIHFDYPFVE